MPFRPKRQPAKKQEEMAEMVKQLPRHRSLSQVSYIYTSRSVQSSFFIFVGIIDGPSQTSVQTSHSQESDKWGQAGAASDFESASS